MKYSNVVCASAFALAGVAHATSDNTVTGSMESDYKVECIEAGIADELPDDQMDAFVAQCLQDKLAAVRQLKQKKS